MRKGQITTIIIIGIIILLLGTLFYLLISKPKQIEQLNLQPIDNFIETCIETYANKGIQLLASQGGLIYLDKYLKTNYSDIHYSYYNKKQLVSKEQMESELNTFMLNAIPVCVENFTSFPYNIKQLELNTSTKINLQDIIIQTNYLLEIENKKYPRKYSTNIHLPLLKLHTLANKILDNIDSNWLDLTYLSDLNIPITIDPISENEYIIGLKEKNLVFNIAFYQPPNKAPIFNPPSEIEMIKGQPFHYKFTAPDPENQKITFSDNNAMIELQEDGSLSTTPTIRGSYEIEITASDSISSTTKKVKFIVK